MAQRRWSPEENALLADLYREGRSLAYLGQRFGVKPNAVKQRLHRLKVKRPPEASRARARPPRGAPSPPVELTLTARLAALQGLVPPVEAAPEPLQDEALREWIADPETFFRWLSISLFPYQRESLGIIQGNDRVCLVWPRQHGKDLLTGLYGLWMALLKPGSIIVCVSPSQRQSDLWFDKLKTFALAKREIRDSIVDLSQSEMAFANGSKVVSLPSGASGSATIRGFSRVSLLVANEAAWVEDSTFQAAQPFLAVTGKGAKLILASTPFGQTGYLWRSFNSEVFARHHVTTISNPLIPADFIEKERQSMDALSFASEWSAQFISGQTSFFPTELIHSCTQAYMLTESPPADRKGLRFFLGCDWARVAGADKTVLTIVAIEDVPPPQPLGGLSKYATPEAPILGRGRVLWIKTFEGVDYVTQAGYVLWLHQQWHFRTVFSDASNHAMTDLLTSKGIPVEPVSFTVPGKVELFGRLKNSMEAGRLTIPNHPDMLRELATFQYKISEHGNLLLHHTEGGHDDYPDSLALAAKAITMEVPRAGGVAVIAGAPGGMEPYFKIVGPKPSMGGVYRETMERLSAASVSIGGEVLLSEQEVEKLKERRARLESSVRVAQTDDALARVQKPPGMSEEEWIREWNLRAENTRRRAANALSVEVGPTVQGPGDATHQALSPCGCWYVLRERTATIERSPTCTASVHCSNGVVLEDNFPQDREGGASGVGKKD